MNLRNSVIVSYAPMVKLDITLVFGTEGVGSTPAGGAFVIERIVDFILRKSKVENIREISYYLLTEGL